MNSNHYLSWNPDDRINQTERFLHGKHEGARAEGGEKANPKSLQTRLLNKIKIKIKKKIHRREKKNKKI